MKVQVMPNYLMRCLSCNAVLLYLILTVLTGASSEDNQGLNKLHMAKRSFLFRERDYLKDKPLSTNLKSFINRYKRRSLGFLGKSKRNDELKENVYVVKDGNIEKLENMSEVTADMPSSDPSGLGNFTVIPLIIPITVKTFTNSTFCHNITKYNDDEDKEPTELMKKTKKTTEFVEEEYTEESTEEKLTTSTGSTGSESTGSESTGSASTGSESTGSESTGSDSTTSSSSHSTSNSTSENNGTSTLEIIVDDATSTTSQNMKVLSKVLNDVQELMSYEKDGKAAGTNQGAMCTVTGDWDSKAGGMQLRITTNNDSLKTPSVEVVQQEPEPETGFLRIGKWNLTTLLPFNHSSALMVTAISERTVATFLGDCRICEGAEAITGNWMVMEKSANCKDRQETHAFFSDVMRKNNVRKLQKAHLDEMSTRDLTTTTTTMTEL